MKPPEIEFRMPVCSPRNFLPGDEGATFRTWGLRNASPSNQYLGSVPLKEHLTIGFPNIYQHRFTPCTLENTEVEGSMRILSFFMVDPDLSNGEGGTDLILSSSDVPPQSKAWMRRAVEESIDFRLPNEVIDRILDFVKGVMTEEEAREYATRMRKERERFWSMHDERWFCLPFDTWSGAG